MCIFDMLVYNFLFKSARGLRTAVIFLIMTLILRSSLDFDFTKRELVFFFFPTCIYNPQAQLKTLVAKIEDVGSEGAGGLGKGKGKEDNFNGLVEMAKLATKMNEEEISFQVSKSIAYASIVHLAIFFIVDLCCRYRTQKLSRDLAEKRLQAAVAGMREEMETKAAEAAAELKEARSSPISSDWQDVRQPADMSRKQLEELVTFMLPPQVRARGLKSLVEIYKCESQHSIMEV